jgi:hypothetical protein
MAVMAVVIAALLGLLAFFLLRRRKNGPRRELKNSVTTLEKGSDNEPLTPAYAPNSAVSEPVSAMSPVGELDSAVVQEMPVGQEWLDKKPFDHKKVHELQ